MAYEYDTPPKNVHSGSRAGGLVHPLIGRIDKAGRALERLDERLKRSPEIGAGFIARSHFQEACAMLWMEGALVPLEDLVLHDGLADRRAPTHEVIRAARLLRLRRRAQREPADWTRSENGLRTLTDREERGGTSDRLDRRTSHSSPREGQGMLLGKDPDYDEEGRLAVWRNVVEQGEMLPPVQAAALALDAWLTLEPIQKGSALGYVLVASELRRTMTPTHLPSIALGLKISKARWRAYDAQDQRLLVLLAGLEAGALAAMDQLNRLNLARQLMLQRCEGKQRNSKLPQLIDLFIASPYVTVALAKKKLDVTPAAVTNMFDQLGSTLPPELTGRGRYRAWGIL